MTEEKKPPRVEVDGVDQGPPQVGHQRNRAEFWRDVAERVVRAFAGGMLAGLAVGYETFAKGALPWWDSFYLGIGCAVIALLLSLVGGQIGDRDSGSIRKHGASPQNPEPPPLP